MIYKILTKNDANQVIYACISDDGKCYKTLTDDYQPFQDWLAEGNTPLPPDESDPWEVIRQKRDQLIRDSDWTMIPGATVDQAQWSAYRQILRDLPQTYSNPEDVVWPTPPSTSGPNTIEE
jgi:hypothetical protein